MGEWGVLWPEREDEVTDSIATNATTRRFIHHKLFGFYATQLWLGLQKRGLIIVPTTKPMEHKYDLKIVLVSANCDEALAQSGFLASWNWRWGAFFSVLIVAVPKEYLQAIVAVSDIDVWSCKWQHTHIVVKMTMNTYMNRSISVNILCQYVETHISEGLGCMGRWHSLSIRSKEHGQQQWQRLHPHIAIFTHFRAISRGRFHICEIIYVNIQHLLVLTSRRVQQSPFLQANEIHLPLNITSWWRVRRKKTYDMKWRALYSLQQWMGIIEIRVIQEASEFVWIVAAAVVDWGQCSRYIQAS